MSLYSPEPVPLNPAELPAYLEREFAKIQASVNVSELPTSYAVPAKVSDGLFVLADGTSWNPGSGQGVYVYYNSAWHFLG